MRIIVDKVVAFPPHAICRADVRIMLASVPAAWAEKIDVFRLSASKATFVALYNSPDKIFTIASRGHTPEDTLRLALEELAAHSLGFKSKTFQHLQSRHKARVNSLVAPLVIQLLPKLMGKKTREERETHLATLDGS